MHVIECAVRANGIDQPAWTFLTRLRQGMWEPDPDVTELPDDAQISHFHKLMNWFRRFGNTGLPAYQRAVNNLNDGIWEFKLGKKRLSFYDTDGKGGFEPKLRVTNLIEGVDDDFPWFPNFDSIIRLGHAFPKTEDYTEDFDLNETIHVREEDVEHDK